MENKKLKNIKRRSKEAQIEQTEPQNEMSESDKRILDIYDRMKEHYGDKLANFEQYPRIFAHQYKLLKYYETRKK